MSDKALIETYLEMSDVDVGRLASGGYGKEKQTKFLKDFRLLVVLALRGAK